jgi:hypothetical protein
MRVGDLTPISLPNGGGSADMSIEDLPHNKLPEVDALLGGV